MTRKVYADEDRVDFASSFYPVDSVISVYNTETTRALSVWNDRPQAGSVHSNQQSGGIKLLVDRRIGTLDKGGCPGAMSYHFTDDLVVNFRFKTHQD